jgi:two-component system cell cycle response regulator CtrA
VARLVIHWPEVAVQPCLICGRQPCDPHRSCFARPRALALSHNYLLAIVAVPVKILFTIHSFINNMRDSLCPKSSEGRQSACRPKFKVATKGTCMRALLIEDDKTTARSIELILKSESINVYTTDLGEDAVDLGKLYDYDIILLDLNLPDMSGFEVLRCLRVSKVKTPTLILSGLTGIENKVKGLGLGADDYMTKPFHKDELVARIHAIVRRAKGHAQSIIQTGDLAVNLDTKTVEVNGVRVHLTGKEYQMLELLSLRKGTSVTKEMFLTNLYGGMDEPEIKIIDVFICKLRKKLANASFGKNYIETVWSRGYSLRQLTNDEGVKISA